MVEFTINDKTYSLAFTMLSVVRAKTLVGKGFFELASKQDVGEGENGIDPEAAMQKVLELLLLALQTNHAQEFKSIEDVARAFPTMKDIADVTPLVNESLVKFFAVDENLQKQLSDAKNANDTGIKKKPRSTRSPKNSTPPNVESASD